jgi:hypothetical protein
MNRLIAIALAAGVALSAASAADARQGCGAGFHRAAYGRCVPNARRMAYRAGPRVLVVNRYYTGRGYWDGRRYWQHRQRRHNRWLYR